MRCPTCRRSYYPQVGHQCVIPTEDRVTGPVPVDDPAPYRADSHDREKDWEIFDAAQKRKLAVEEGLAESRCLAERRLTIAAQFMAAQLTGDGPMVSQFGYVADYSLQAADALIARWKETT
jgi:hypothetical protein